MTYIPVGTRLTYTASFTSLVTSASEMVAKLKADLPNLQGMEELDVETAEETTNVFSANTFSLTVLNNGVDHADEHDIQSIIDGTIQGYSSLLNPIDLVSSSITKITLPNNPESDSPININTGAGSNQPAPSTSGFSLSSLLPSTGTKLLTTGTIIIIAIIALILLLPGGFARVFKTVRN